MKGGQATQNLMMNILYYQMEAYDSKNEGSRVHLTPIDFGKIIDTIESQCQKSLLTRKNQILQKQQQKQNWLSKTKIIPPSFPRFNSGERCEFTGKSSTFHQNMFSDNGKATSKNIQSKNESLRRMECKTSYGNGRNIGSPNRVKSNWKLQFRRDQLNVLKYKQIRSIQEEHYLQNPSKMFKIRKIIIKPQEGVPGSCSNKRFFGDITDFKTNVSRKRLKTAQVQELFKHNC